MIGLQVVLDTNQAAVVASVGRHQAALKQAITVPQRDLPRASARRAVHRTLNANTCPVICLRMQFKAGYDNALYSIACIVP